MSNDISEQGRPRMRRLAGLLVLLAAGLVSGFALPPFGQWWVLALTLPVYFWRLEALPERRWGQGFSSGLAFGFGYFVAAFHWIGFAFFINPADIWMMPFAVGGLALFMAGYWGIASALVMLVPRSIAPRWLLAVLFLAVVEWLRGHLLTGFPWAVPGLAADGMGAVAQLASLVGMNGLTLLILLWAALPAVLWSQWRSRRRLHVAALVILLLLPLSEVWGLWRLQHNPATYNDGFVVRLVQPNISQDDKWRADNASNIFSTLMNLSRDGAGEAGVKLVVWPESSVPFLLDEDKVALSQIAGVLSPGRTLLAGAIRRDRGTNGNDLYYTSVVAINEQAEVSGRYDKWRLVPGGEFLPWEGLLTRLGFRKVVSLPESFTAGSGPQNLAVPGLGLVAPLVCYEVIFPGRLVAETRPQLLVNVTNDGWFGRSTGPYQHLAQARLRTIEQGLPLIRSANTGISAVIDPLGRIVVRTELLVRTVVDNPVPLPLAATTYARLGDLTLFLLLVTAWLALRNSVAIMGRLSNLV
jgi:apolipoprotein N-acyltransferase